MGPAIDLIRHVARQTAVALRSPPGTIVRKRAPMQWRGTSVFAPVPGGRTVVGTGAEWIARAARPFSASADAMPAINPADPTAVVAHYGGRMRYRAVPVRDTASGWHGDIAVYDSAPELADDPAVVPIVVTHGLTTSNLLFADVINALFDVPEMRAVRVLAVDLPGHGASSKPSPAEFTYAMMDAARVARKAIDTLGIDGRYIHVTQSLGQIVVMDDVHSGRFRIARNISVGTSPRQVALQALEPVTQRRATLGGRSIVEAAMHRMPQALVDWTDFFDLLWLWVGVGAEQHLMQSCLVQSRDSATRTAWAAYLHGLDQYRERGVAMEAARVPEGTCVHFDMFSGAQDVVMPPEHTEQHVRALARVPGFTAVHHAAPGGHVTFGDFSDPHSMRARVLQCIRSAIREWNCAAG